VDVIVGHIAPLVRTERDTWDWVLYWLSVAAALSAIVALWTWWTNLRRVPEVGFRWEMPNGESWGPRETVSLRPGDAVEMRVVLDNLGSAAASLLIVNVMVPRFLDLRSEDRDGNSRHPHPSADVAIGCPPDHAVTFVVARTEEFVPGIAYIVRYRVTVPKELSPSNPRDFYFAVSAEAERFRRSGHLIIPSFGVAASPTFWNQLEWPGGRYPWWPPRQIRTRPETVRAGPGRRIDRRHVVISK